VLLDPGAGSPVKSLDSMQVDPMGLPPSSNGMSADVAPLADHRTLRLELESSRSSRKLRCKFCAPNTTRFVISLLIDATYS
jgi:hypothetical protein